MLFIAAGPEIFYLYELGGKHIHIYVISYMRIYLYCNVSLKSNFTINCEYFNVM